MLCCWPRRRLSCHRRCSSVIDDLKETSSWTDADLTTYVTSGDVVDAGLVKRQVLLGGYQAQMQETVDDLLADMADADKAVYGARAVAHAESDLRLPDQHRRGQRLQAGRS